MAGPEALPRLDEHATEVEATPDAVWTALVHVLDRNGSRRPVAGFARAVGCSPRAAAGPRPLAEGSAVPGFAVTSATPGRELVLEGQHHFSRYALLFRLDDLGSGRTQLRAESRAVFPGPLGAAYRLAVVGTRGHVVAVRSLLGSIRRRAEASAAA